MPTMYSPGDTDAELGFLLQSSCLQSGEDAAIPLCLGDREVGEITLTELGMLMVIDTRTLTPIELETIADIAMEMGAMLITYGVLNTGKQQPTSKGFGSQQRATWQSTCRKGHRKHRK